MPLAERLATGSQFASPVPLSHVMFAAGVGERSAAAAGALLPRAAPDCAAPPAHRVPQLPRAWGRVKTLTDLRLGDTTVHVRGAGQAAKVRGLPDDWQLITPQE